MKFLLLYPDWQPKSIDKLKCFSDVWGFYLGNELSKHVSVTCTIVPTSLEDEKLSAWFKDLPVEEYDAVLAMGLRYFSQVPREITDDLRRRVYPGFLCQLYDGSRLDNDGVDITFTIKNNDNDNNYVFCSSANRFVRHRAFNEYIGWAADPDLNSPSQSETELRFLVDHTNYSNNPVDRTDNILGQIREFAKSEIWKDRWKSLVVRRFDSGKVVTVDLDDDTPVKRYDRTGIPYREICREHGNAHVFFVTHPESVGLVVLETAMAGALTVTPAAFIPEDRLATVRHIKYTDRIDWQKVLLNIDPAGCREQAQTNSWEQVAKRIRDAIQIRKLIRRSI